MVGQGSIDIEEEIVMIRVYQGFAIHGHERDIWAFEEALTDLADAYSVVLDGEFEDMDTEDEDGDYEEVT